MSARPHSPRRPTDRTLALAHEAIIRAYRADLAALVEAFKRKYPRWASVGAAKDEDDDAPYIDMSAMTTGHPIAADYMRALGAMAGVKHEDILEQHEVPGNKGGRTWWSRYAELILYCDLAGEMEAFWQSEKPEPCAAA